MEPTIRQVDAVLDMVDEDESPADDLAALIDQHGEWSRSEDLDQKYAVIESSGAIWYVHEDPNGCADCRRCATWDEALALMPAQVQS